jgi:hypothetical protein
MTLNPTANGNANLDSGCLMSMTPNLHSVEHARANHTPVHLANHSVGEATHKGGTRLPIEGNAPIKTLVVPSLHNPLLSITSLCNTGLTVVFTKTSCDLYGGSSFNVEGSVSGRGYCWGNLYYLPSKPVSSCSVITALSAPVNSSLLGYHMRFSHLGLKPLKLR